MIIIIVFTKIKKAFNASILEKRNIAVRWGVTDLWWLFWLGIHFLFLIVLMKDPMKEIIQLPDELVTASTLFPLIIGYSLLVPAVFISILTTIAVYFYDYRKDRTNSQTGTFRGYKTVPMTTLPFIYLFTNHLLIILAGVFPENTERIKLAMSVAAIKIIADTFIHTAANHKKYISSDQYIKNG